MEKNNEGNPGSAVEKAIRIERYRGSKYWGVWLGEKLLTVTVYKRGAQSVAELVREVVKKHPSQEINIGS